MSLRIRMVALTIAGLIAAGYTASLMFDPLCSVFRSKRHYAGAPEPHMATTTASPNSLAAHR